MNEQELKAERLRILDDTAKFYNSNNRGLQPNGNCCYITPDGKRCAIGRLVSTEHAVKMQIQNDSITYAALTPELSALGILFLEKLQMFHDTEEVWNDNGLSDFGKDQYEIIKAVFC